MQQIIQHISIVSALLPVLFYLFCKSRFEYSRWLLYYFLMSLFIELLLYSINEDQAETTKKKYILYTFFNLEFLMLSAYFYKQHIFKDKRIVFLISLIGVVVYHGIFIYKSLPVFNSNGCTVFALILMSYCIFGFKKLLQSEAQVFLERLAFFWVLCGLLLYFSGIFFLYTFTHQIKGLSKELYNSLWSFVHDVLNIIKCCLIAFSFTKKQEQ